MVFDGKCQLVYVIRIGGRYAGPPTLSFERQTKMDRLPPRISSLRLQQQKLCRDTELAIVHVHIDLFVGGKEDSLCESASSPSPTLSHLPLPLPSPSPLSPSLACHPRCHCSAVTIALFVAHHPRCHRHPSCHRPCPLHCPPPSFPSPSPFPPLPSLLLPSSSTACHRRSLLPTVVVVWSPRQCSLASHRPPLSIPSLVDCCSPAVAIAPSLAHHPCCHCSCRRRHRPLRCTPPTSPTPWPVPPLPSSLTGTLIAITIALAILALFDTAITICRTLSSYVVAHPRGRVVTSLMPSCQPPPAFVAPSLVDCHDYPTLPDARDPSAEGGKGDT
jgi:hypothetical protein